MVESPFNPLSMLVMVKPAIVLGFLLALAFLFARVMRSRQLPRCTSCGAFAVRPSRRNGVLEQLARYFLVEPQRCDSCQVRFYSVLVRRPRAVYRTRTALPRTRLVIAK